MSSRERTLLLAVVSVVVLLATLLVFTLFSRKRVELQAAIVARDAELAAMQSLADQRELWAARDAWLQQQMPKLTNPSGAGVNLLEQIKELARAQGALFQNPAINPIAKNKLYQIASINFETKSDWAQLVKFLATLQDPGSFLVVEEARIQIDPADPTQMQAKLRVARWFAP